MKKLAMAAFAAMSLLSAPASAMPSVGVTAPDQTLVQKTYYVHRWRHGYWGGPRFGFYGGGGYGGPGCYTVRRDCAYRWGWGGPRFRRCVWNLGCG